jgi:hypothetical protein
MVGSGQGGREGALAARAGPLRAPITLTLLTVLAGALGVWLALGGLWLRLFGEPLASEGFFGIWRSLPEFLGVPATAFGWPMIVVGTGWLGALTGLWMRLGWSRRVAWALALASLFHLGAGTVVAVAAAGCLADPRLRSWVETSPG